jgi:hypothetical protein
MNVFAFLKRYTVALGGATYALSLGVARPRHRALIHDIASHFGYDDHPPRTLPRVNGNTLTSSRTTVTLPEPYEADGNVSLLELLVLARLVRERNPRGIFEIGTFDGRTALTLAANAAPDTTVYTLDLPPSSSTRFPLATDDHKYVEKPRSGERFAGHELASKIRQLFGDSGSFDFAGYRADIVFVDGSHAYDYVLNDSMRALDLLPDGQGDIVWHDYGVWPGVTRALNDLRASDARFRDLAWIEGTSLVHVRR